VVDGDEDELHGVVGNVVGNAMKYSDTGGRVWVSLTRCHQDCDGALFRCVDEGIGISAEDQARLFTPFFRSSDASARSRPGTGLGLAIVKEVVERHKGRLHLTSEPGRGSTFEICLPVLEAPGEDD
jgi:signal transduction histidine kinase